MKKIKLCLFKERKRMPKSEDTCMYTVKQLKTNKYNRKIRDFRKKFRGLRRRGREGGGKGRRGRGEEE